MRTGALIVLSLSLCSCAAVFRGTKDHVRVESTPAGAEAKKGDRKLGITPMEFDAERNGVTQLTLTKSGYEDHHGTVKKDMNGAWLALDIITCLPLICVPLLIDAMTGAWYDVDTRYVAAMKPGTSGAVAVATSPVVTTPAPSATPSTSAAAPAIEMSESERKATARAAYVEGVELKEKGNCGGAIPRFEVAQKYYPAPTHLLQLAQCQAATGKLVEASETYETLARAPLAKDAPEAFRQSQEEGKKELLRIKPRVPTLRIQLTPTASSLSSLVVKLNGSAIPNELVGIARPVNPGHYKVTVWAAGYKEASSELELGEAAAKALDIKLSK